VNDVPVTQALSTTAVSGAMAVIDVLQVAVDPDGDSLTVSSVIASVNATALIANGKIEYTANSGFWGEDTLTYTISDGNGGEASGVVGIIVEQPAPPPATELVTYFWDYPGDTRGLARFRLYMNGLAICETKNARALSLSCTVPTTTGPRIFAVTSVDKNGVESAFSNSIQY
jgi:hypothetical protein